MIEESGDSRTSPRFFLKTKGLENEIISNLFKEGKKYKMQQK